MRLNRSWKNDERERKRKGRHTRKNRSTSSKLGVKNERNTKRHNERNC